VPGALATRGSFLAHNRRLIAEVAELEHKARRQDVLVDEEAIAAFYAARVPQGVATLVAFERWREDAERTDPQVLHLTRDALMRHAAAGVTEDLFPETMAMAGSVLPLKYRFAPGQSHDGLTLTVPLALLNQIDVARLSREPNLALWRGLSSRVIFWSMDVLRETTPHVTGKDGTSIPNPLRDLRVRRREGIGQGGEKPEVSSSAQRHHPFNSTSAAGVLPSRAPWGSYPFRDAQIIPTPQTMRRTGQ